MKTYNVTFVKAYTVTITASDNCDIKDLEDTAYVTMMGNFSDGTDYEPQWEMTDCSEVSE